MQQQPLRLGRPDGHTIAYLKRASKANGLGVLWLSGFKSEMTGTKASALDAWAARTGRGYTRFDYFGHGASSGDFRQGTISRWRDDALSVIDQITEGPQLLVASSMGAWIALHSALARPERIAGMVLIAPAPDFTEALLWPRLPDDARRQIEVEGVWLRPSDYDPEPYPITRALIEDGRKNLLLDGPIPLRMPIHILHGMSDPDVPWAHALRLVERLASSDVTLELIKGGDHRLSSAPEIARLENRIDQMLARL
ncbi:MAG: alpha/beta fold hydrolase [Alphaproteobacteria bacterium]|nr:alpha/beta fold hydrolase [Alphaproteobacteria bacterium]